MKDNPFESPGPKGLRSLQDILAGVSKEPPPFNALLEAILTRPTIQDKWFKEKTIYLDGYTFERCRFDGCQLVTEHATFVLRHCVIAPDCKFHFLGPSLKVVRLLMRALADRKRIQPVEGEAGLFPQQNPDGTFTLE